MGPAPVLILILSFGQLTPSDAFFCVCLPRPFFSFDVAPLSLSPKRLDECLHIGQNLNKLESDTFLASERLILLTHMYIYVCMVITYSRVSMNRVRLPILFVVG